MVVGGVGSVHPGAGPRHDLLLPQPRHPVRQEERNGPLGGCTVNQWCGSGSEGSASVSSSGSEIFSTNLGPNLNIHLLKKIKIKNKFFKFIKWVTGLL